MAAAPLKVEFLKSKKGKNKATFQGFVYTLTKSSSEVQHWVCKMRIVCKARMHTRGDVIIKPTLQNEIHSTHSHESDPVRIEILKGYSKVIERSIDSEESTRVILFYGIEQMGASSVAQLPKFESVKRTIRMHKSRSEEKCGKILVPEKYKVTLKQEPFLLFDSGYGDVCFSHLADSRTWYAGPSRLYLSISHASLSGSHPSLSGSGTCLREYVNNYRELTMLLSDGTMP